MATSLNRKSWMTVLREVKAKLGAISGVQTCKIGFEEGISPDDYPLIRIVPLRMSKASENTQRAVMEVMIYFGHAIHAFEDDAATAGIEGLEDVYDKLFALEQSIVEALRVNDGYRVEHVDTATDEDRMAAFKLMGANFKITA